MLGYDTGFTEPPFDKKYEFFHNQSSIEIKKGIYLAFNCIAF